MKYYIVQYSLYIYTYWYTYISNNVRYKLYTNVFCTYSLFSKSYTIPASLASRCSAGPAKGRQPRGKVSRGPGGACPNLVLHNLRNLKKKTCCILKRCSPGISDTRPLHPSFSRKMWGCQRSKWFRLVFVRQFNDSKIYEDFRSDIQAHASLSDCLGNAQLHQILALSPQWRNAVQQLTRSLIVWSVAACLLQFLWLGWPVDTVDLLLFHWLHGFHHLRRQTKNIVKKMKIHKANTAPS